MSAAQCSSCHLSALAIAAVRLQVFRSFRGTDDPRQLEQEALEVLGEANALSVSTLYGRSVDYQPSLICERVRARQFSPVELIKLCDFYAYQACEAPTWTGCRAQVLVEYIKQEAIKALPGYEAAPWGLGCSVVWKD